MRVIDTVEASEAKAAKVVEKYFARQTPERIRWGAKYVVIGYDLGLRIHKPGEVRKHLARLIDLQQKLCDAIESMPLELESIISGLTRGDLARNALLTPFSPRQVMGREVKRLGDIFGEANKRLAPKSGRPNSEPAASVTALAAMVYEELSGKPATPGWNDYAEKRSPFEQFLADIFEALGIDANAERQAKSLRDKMKKK